MRDQQKDPEWRAEEVEFNRRLGSNIATARRLVGLPQHELAGLTYSQVTQIERGRRFVSIDELQQIADALGVTATSLLPTLRERIAR